MKTTLNIDEGVMGRLKAQAAREGRTMSELLEAALRQFLRRAPASTNLPPLPSFDGGQPRVNIANREALLDFMDRD